MALSQVFVGFLQSVALGSATVFALFAFVALKARRRSLVLITRKPSR